MSGGGRAMYMTEAERDRQHELAWERAQPARERLFRRQARAWLARRREAQERERQEQERRRGA